ncbi:MAG: galactose-1-phosphate uridylyltransferase [Candidatus Nealsonbacteria bacterium]|nr:galactose-1-phosphate uridylyltransferase [Candidatus Nealsonbacteria bacterium]
MAKHIHQSFPSELRFDSISRDWVVIATGRAKRPEMFKKEKRVRSDISRAKCPFCRRDQSEKVLLDLPNVFVISNKYPSFLPSPKLEKRSENHLYQAMNAVGFCEVVVTKDHQKSLAQLSLPAVKEVIDSYQGRYLDLMEKAHVNYISVFHNHGLEAGASQPHPHSQIITSPLIDHDLEGALLNAKRYFKKNKHCVYCRMMEWEKKVGERIVFENEDFLVLAPFASKAAFELIVSPKNHLPYFERINEKEKAGLAEAFKEALRKLHKGLGDPAYNFYLHTSPCQGKDYSYYHWHWTILPKTATWAGFEIGTRMEISTIEPEKAAEYLRKQ